MTDTKNQSKENSRANSPEKRRGNSGNNSRTQSRQEREKKNYFKEELRRLQESLQKEATRIKKPERKSHTPYTFVSLSSYHDATLVSRAVHKTNDDIPRGNTSRQTAIGLIDPWTAHTMDQNHKRRGDSNPSPQPEQSKKEVKKKKANKKTKEGSTRLPKFPAVSVPTGNMAAKTLTYKDVPMLRKELKEKYSNNAQEKIDKEYTRTKQDFYRMDLDQMEEYHPINRKNMEDAYFAYLQNNPGSRKAVKECVHQASEALGETKSPRSRPTSAVSQQSRPTSSHSRRSVKA